LATEHILRNEAVPIFHKAEIKKSGLYNLIHNFREVFHVWMSKAPEKTEKAPVVTSGADLKQTDNEPPRKKRRDDTPTGLKHLIFEDREKYPNRKLADILGEKTEHRYIVVDEDVKVIKRSEAIRILEYDLEELKAANIKVEDVSDNDLLRMFKKRYDKAIIIPDDDSIKVATRSNAVEWIKKLMKKDKDNEKSQPESAL
jgi:hypothetical protein